MQRIAGFDGIRGLSVIAVVFTHLHVYVALNEAGLLSSSVLPMVHGSAGVQAFFILSGFLITYLLVKEYEETGKICIRFFYIRRTIRIFPIYFLIILIVLFLNMFLQTDLNETLFIYAFLYSYNFIPKEYYSTLIGHTWSLAVEEHFYLLWPITFVFLFRKISQRLLIVSAVAIAISHITLEVLSLSARAFSDHSGSYPELTKKFAHSVGVNSSMISAMAAQRSSTVRAAAFLSNALSFEKACSMGLKSGE